MCKLTAELALRGENPKGKLRGRYELVRFESAGENEWRLFRKKA